MSPRANRRGNARFLVAERDQYLRRLLLYPIELRARSLQNTGVFRNSHTPEHANIEAGMLVVLFPRASGDALRL